MTAITLHLRNAVILFSLGLFCAGAPLAAQNVTCLNVEPAAVRAMLDEAGLTPMKGNPQSGGFEGSLVILQARGPVSDEVAEALGRFVQGGGSLLVGFDESAGIGIQRLGFMLPTMAWHSKNQQERRGAAQLIEPDPEFFPDPEGVKDFAVRFHYEIRPWHAVERGQARYDRYLRPVPYKDFGQANPSANDLANLLPKGSFWWTRPLMNRDWKVRARCNDYAQTPLLITGRYGAGKVAVFASKFEEVERDAPFWSAVIGWLQKPEASDTATEATVAMEFGTGEGVPLKSRELEVTLTNRESTPVKALLLGRVLTWEGAIVGDTEVPVALPPGATVKVALPLPEKASATSYQALAARDEYTVRVGLLSADGGKLLAEAVRMADLRPPLSVQVVTTEERGRQRPFKAPAIGKESRSGLPIHSYAYKPGATVEGEVIITNGVRNLAPLAQIRDENNPGNPSLAALTDEASRAEARPDWYALDAWGFYEGKPGQEQVLTFTFPREAMLTAVTLYGAADRYRNHMRHNPKLVVIEADGVEVAREGRAEWRIPQGHGVLRLEFPATKAKTITVRLGELGVPPRLAEIGIEGAMGEPLPGGRKERLSLQWRNALTNETHRVLEQVMEVPPLGRVALPFTVNLPEQPEATPYCLEAAYGPEVGTIPVLAVGGTRSLLPIEEVVSPDDVSIGFIVTRGFRNLFNTGVGTQEILEGWGQPDDLVWAYSRGLKQNGPETRMQANRLYVSDNDMRHYSTPWRSFYNGERFWDVALPLLVERAKEDRAWKSAKKVHLGFSDRWDTGPTVNLAYSWMDLEAFHKYLKSQGGVGLKGKTREELVREVNQEHSGPFNAWQLQEYTRDIENFRTRFAAEGKKVLIQAQGAPLVPLKEAAVISGVVAGMNDDNTWGMAESSIPLTTGRQMGVMAFNPYLAMAALGSWGWDESALNNSQWRGPVGTTEPSRRHIYDRAFRGVIQPDGSYRAMNTYGYNFNGGAAFTLNENDYNQWQRVEERQSLLTPEAPIGAGLIFSTAYLEAPESLQISGGGPGGSSADKETMRVASFVRRLHENGISLPFSGNAGMLARWEGTAPLVLVNAERFGSAELAALRRFTARGGRVVAFGQVGERTGLSPEVALFFGVNAEGKAQAGQKAGTFAGRDVTVRGATLFVPLGPLPLTESEGRELAPLLKAHLDLPLRFEPGSAGYGFRSGGRSFVVVEDWREEGRRATVYLKAAAGVRGLRAASVNEHEPLKVSRKGGEWAIEVPLRPGDAELICVEEIK